MPARRRSISVAAAALSALGLTAGASDGDAASSVHVRMMPIPQKLAPFLQKQVQVQARETNFVPLSDFQTINYKEIIRIIEDPSCAGVDWFNITVPCSLALPTLAGALSFLAVLMLMCLHMTNFRIKKCRQRRRLEKLAADGGATSPWGSILEQYEAPGGAALCADCETEVQMVWGSKKDKWAVCNDCYLERKAYKAKMELELAPSALQGKNDAEMENETEIFDEEANKVEIVMAMRDWRKNQNHMEAWLRNRLKDRAEELKIDDAAIEQMLKQCDIEDNEGSAYTSYEALTDEFHDKMFPVTFNYKII